MCGAAVALAQPGCPACGEDMAPPAASELDGTGERRPAIAADRTIMPRYIAATLDNVIAMALCVAVAKTIRDDLPVAQALVLVASYLGYYLLFEGAIGRTPGKLFTGLVVIPFEGGRCSWRQALIRTAFRLLEVNPLVLGGLPAAVRIVWSRNHQRFGDRYADTVVVLSRRVR